MKTMLMLAWQRIDSLSTEMCFCVSLFNSFAVDFCQYQCK